MDDAKTTWWMRTAKFVLAQWMLIGFGIVCVLAYKFPTVAAPGGAIRSEYSVLYGAVGVIFLVSGMQLAPDQLKQNATNWRLHLVVQGMCFVVFPAVVLGIIRAAISAGSLTTHTPSPAILVGLLTVACLPTTIGSNVVMTRAALGDEAATVVCVVLGNVLGAFISPLLIYACFFALGELDAWRPARPDSLRPMYARVARQVVLGVVLPLVVGQALRWVWEEQTKRVLRVLRLSIVSSLCVVALIWTTFSGAFATGALLQLSHASVIFTILLNVVLFCGLTYICFLAARPPRCLACLLPTRLAPRPMSKQQAVAICFCGAAKTTSLGIPLVAAMWSSADDLTRAFIQIPVLLYTMEQVFLAQVLVYIFRSYVRRGEKSDSDLEGSQVEDAPATSTTDAVHNATAQVAQPGEIASDAYPIHLSQIRHYPRE